jgi:hypothetical protein
MSKLPGQWSFTIRAKTRYLFFDLLGVAGLMLKRHYVGPYQEVVWSYGGNIAASFAVYYVVALLSLPARISKLLAAGLALLVVELFEASNGFGVMANVYDPGDFAANVVGVALALAVDIVTSGISRRPRHYAGGLGSGLPLT